MRVEQGISPFLFSVHIHPQTRRERLNMTHKLDAAAMPDANGFFGDYGGQLVPPHLKKAMDDISAAYDEIVQRKKRIEDYFPNLICFLFSES